MKYSTLDLGDGSDARLWEAGCQKIGMSPENSIIGSSATGEQLAGLFGGLPDWVYFSGHFAPVTLYGDFAAIDFKPDRIAVVTCLLYTSPSPRDRTRSRMPSSA